MRTLPALAIIVAATAARADVGTLADATARSQAGDHAGAIRLYEQSYARDRDPALLAILGHEYTSVGRLRDALQRFCSYLVVSPTGDDAKAVLAQLEILRAQLSIEGNACAAGAALVAPGTVPAAPPAPGMSRHQLGVAAAAVGVVGLAAGVYFQTRINGIVDQIDNHDPAQPWSANAVDLEVHGHRYQAERDIAFGVGATALVAAGILYVTGREAHVQIAPVVARGGGGLAIGRGF